MITVEDALTREVLAPAAPQERHRLPWPVLPVCRHLRCRRADSPLASAIAKAFRQLYDTHPVAAALMVETVPRTLRPPAETELLGYSKDTHGMHPGAGARGKSGPGCARNVIGRGESQKVRARRA